ncbi:peptidoglycan-binding protein [Oscillatoria amoena NRMC-F 0135]|nr:peptidoglycan-binding protein [Geitlerinema splendidum]MDL5047592.1 peptidoglycan-binding protein [Oscillatoria amoena NRMC-F 0135]
MRILYASIASAVLVGSFSTLSPAKGQTLLSPPQAEALTRPTLSLGAQGSAVSELQAALKLLGYYSGPVDGLFAEATAIAVSRFQQAAGIDADSIVGPNTWFRLFPPVTFAATGVAPAPVTPNPVYIPPATEEFPILRRGMSSEAVERLQIRLQEAGFYWGEIDGDFGPTTEAAVFAAQESYGLEVDGIVGPSTWRALFE